MLDSLPLLNRVDPLVLAGFAVLLCAAFVVVVVKCWRTFRFLMTVRKEQNARLHSLRIHKMLDRLGIGSRRYMAKSEFVDVERHLLRCSNCPDLGSCDAFLQGDTKVSPNRFCPNHEELIQLVPPVAAKQDPEVSKAQRIRRQRA